jgi:para-aminobenzoate synthetase/4-amino-4-deoxychorismate lyase
MNRRHSLPAEVYALVEQSPASVLLECSKSHSPDASSENCSQLFLNPTHVCVAYTPADVTALFAEIERAVAAGLTAAGYFAYECGNCFEPKAGQRTLAPGEPLAWFGIYQRSYRFDHAAGVFEGGDLSQLAHFRNTPQIEAEDPRIEAEFELDQKQYAERIEAVQEWIRAGDVYQLNFTAPYRVRVRGSIAALYAMLGARQPVEYGAFIHAQPGERILSFSPELFFRIDNENGDCRITTRPMKGTAARGRTTAEDQQRAEWLRNDPKNRAENLMIVDLLRNDLGRLAKFGTVRTENMFALERLPTLWQMTSTVTGELRPDVGYGDIFRALFPCGSITGAPKVRAMQLLTGLEEQPRGVYTGAIGFFAPQRTVFSVGIRTLALKGDEGIMGVGSGIVIDSVAAEEYGECKLKAEFLLRREEISSGVGALTDNFMLIETMRWDDGYPLLGLHLDRLMDSAGYFDFRCEREQVEAALEEHAQKFVAGVPRKVRLLLDAEGELHISNEVLQLRTENSAARVYVAAERTDPTDRWLFHKTTRRALYAQAYTQAAQRGFDDVLFLNERAELTEGAISNIFIEKDGCMFTPPVNCGVLPGVYRRHLLQTRPEIEERVLSLDNLRDADAVYICNAVRGLRKVQIDWSTGFTVLSVP